MGSRSHRIWIETNGENTGKSFGGNSINLTVNVGSSASYSRQLAEISISQYEDSDGNLSFRLSIDGEVYKRESFDRKKKEFGGIKGFKINGNPMLKERREKKEANSMLRTVGNIAALAEIFCNTPKEKNDWKTRMLKAGLPALDVPEDWNTLTEEEKEKRLNGVIELATKE